MGVELNWKLAIKMAREQNDVTYQEWCYLYVDPARPTRAQVEKAAKTAHPILVRNGVIEEDVRFYFEGNPLPIV